jgi:hypothetical protein
MISEAPRRTPLSSGFSCSVGSPNYVLCAAIIFFASLCLSVSTAIAQSDDLSKVVAYVSLTTSQSPTIEGSPDSLAPNVLVRFTKSDGQSRFLAITDRSGTATVPLEAGRYCADALGLDGRPIKMSDRSRLPLHRCLTIRAGEMLEFSVTLTANAKYVQSLPSVGVQ